MSLDRIALRAKVRQLWMLSQYLPQYLFVSAIGINSVNVKKEESIYVSQFTDFVTSSPCRASVMHHLVEFAKPRAPSGQRGAMSQVERPTKTHAHISRVVLPGVPAECSGKDTDSTRRRRWTWTWRTANFMARCCRSPSKRQPPAA